MPLQQRRCILIEIIDGPISLRYTYHTNTTERYLISKTDLHRLAKSARSCCRPLCRPFGKPQSCNRKDRNLKLFCSFSKKDRMKNGKNRLKDHSLPSSTHFSVFSYAFQIRSNERILTTVISLPILQPLRRRRQILPPWSHVDYCGTPGPTVARPSMDINFFSTLAMDEVPRVTAFLPC